MSASASEYMEQLGEKHLNQTNLNKRPNPSITILIFLLSLGGDTAYWTPTATGTPTEMPASVFQTSPLRLPLLETRHSPFAAQNCHGGQKLPQSSFFDSCQGLNINLLHIEAQIVWEEIQRLWTSYLSELKDLVACSE